MIRLAATEQDIAYVDRIAVLWGLVYSSDSIKLHP